MDDQKPSKTSIADLPSPVTNGNVNIEIMLKAWNMNVETQRDLIDHMRRAESDNAATRRSNRRTRGVMYCVVLLMALSVTWIHHLASEVESGQRAVVELTQTGDRRLGAMEAQIAAVTHAMVSAAEAEAEADVAMADSVVSEPDKREAVLKAKKKVQEVALQAQLAVSAAGRSPDALAANEVAMKLQRLQADAAVEARAPAAAPSSPEPR